MYNVAGNSDASFLSCKYCNSKGEGHENSCRWSKSMSCVIVFFFLTLIFFHVCLLRQRTGPTVPHFVFTLWISIFNYFVLDFCHPACFALSDVSPNSLTASLRLIVLRESVHTSATVGACTDMYTVASNSDAFFCCWTYFHSIREGHEDSCTLPTTMSYVFLSLWQLCALRQHAGPTIPHFVFMLPFAMFNNLCFDSVILLALRCPPFCLTASQPHFVWII